MAATLASYGRCAVFLVAALALDALGLVLVLVGAVAQPALDGQSYGDFLVLTGALLLFLSLLCWLLWYSGNLRGVPADELPLKARPTGEAPRGRRTPAARDSLLRLAAKLSERLSQRRRGSPAAPSLFSPPKTWPAAANAPARPGGAPKLELGSLPRAASSAAQQLQQQQQQGSVVERLV